ncbi:MAG TPA: DUF1566 domain-containing protein [Dehalococcoidia bacterium]|nr:DUF1566 domain-containing protein [Dehalococcoidia bacterium]
MMIRGIGVALTAAVLMASAGAVYGVDPAQQCQAGKNKEAGKYAYCLQKAEASLVKTGDTVKYGEAITKCETKLNDKWAKLEATAAGKGASCPDAPLTEAQFKTVIDEHSDNVTTGLSGGGLQDYPALLTSCTGQLTVCTGVRDQCVNTDLPGCQATRDQCVNIDLPSCQANLTTALACGNAAIDAGEQCDQVNLNGETCATQGFGGGTLACGSGCLFDTGGCYNAPRFVDNGDGTITDKETGLMWEKKAGLGGGPVICSTAGVCPNPHDADNQYTYSFGSPSGPPGTAFTVLLAQLNGGGGFAGHSDWRLPTREELQGIADYADPSSPVVSAAFDTGCTVSCTITTCSCTAPSIYWTSTTTALTANNAWIVDFSNGDVTNDTKDTDYYARAVRP